MSVAAPPPALLTAAEFVRLPDVIRAEGRALWTAGTLTESNMRPDLAVESRTLPESWGEAFRRVVDHLKAGVPRACLLDHPSRTLSIFYPDRLPQALTADDEFTLPDVLPGFQVKVDKLFA
jgi:Uma2 family endonuclease